MNLNISEKIAIIGQSGSGKTTLLDYFITILPYRCVVVDSVGRFTGNRDIRYSGLLKKQTGKTYIKIQTSEDLEKILKIINDSYNKPIYLIVDEIDQYTKPLSMERESSLFFQQGRNYNHGGIFSVRQIGRLNKQIFTNCRYIFLFSTHNKSDIQYLQSSLPFNVPELIYSLKRYQFYIIDSMLSENLGKYILSGKNLIRLE